MIKKNYVLFGILLISFINLISAVNIGSGVTFQATGSNSSVVFDGIVNQFENATISSTSVNVYSFICSNKGTSLNLFYDIVNGIINIDSYCGEVGSVVAPFDLKRIFVVNFSGTAEIFTIFAIVLLAIIMAYVRLPNVLAMVLFCLFALIMFSYAGAFFILIVTIGGIGTYILFSKIWE